MNDSQMAPAREFLCAGCGGELHFPSGSFIALDVRVWHSTCAPDPLPTTRYIIEGNTP